MKRSLCALLLCGLAVALVACQSLSMSGDASNKAQAGTPSDSGRLQSILESRELRVGLSANQPPLNMRNRQGDIIGFEVDLIERLAESMGLVVRYEAMPFAELLGALERDEVDLVISGVTITPDRNANVAFAGPYFISGKSLLTKSEEIANVEDGRALDVPSRTYAALDGSTSERFARDVAPTATIVATRDYDSAIQMVIQDEVDALIADYPICGLSVLRNPEAGLSALVTPFTMEPLGIALPADDFLFVNLVQNYLTMLENTGILIQLKVKWFSDGAWVSELP